MKKLVIASAVAAVLASGAVAADTSVYGNIRLQVESAEQVSMESGKLVIGFKGTEDLGNGMTGFMHLEMEHDGADEKGAGSGGWRNDRSNVGVKGDFGAVTLGVQSDAAGFACGGTDIFTNNSGSACGVGAVNGALNNALSYVGTFGAVTFVGAVTFDGAQTATAGADDTSNSVIAINFDGGDFAIGAQFTTLDKDFVGKADDDTLTALGGTYTMSDITIGLTFADNGGDDNNTAMALAVSIGNVAGGTVKIGADMGDALDKDKGGAGETVNLEYAKSLSKAVYTGVQFSSIDKASGADEDADQIYAYLGYKF